MHSTKNKRILITGGAGFIGSSLAHYFDEKFPQHEVLVIDKFRSNETFSNGHLKSFGHFKNLMGFKGTILQGDINDKSCLDDIKSFKPDIIYHEAAISDTTVAEEDEVMQTNLNAFKYLLDICKDLNSKMIYASSGATYGNAPSPQTVGFNEKPRNSYGFSKIMMDNLAIKYIKQYYLHIVGFRYFNVYGKGEYFKNSTASMVLQFGLQILSGKNPKLFKGSDKICRDFVYIKDVIQANIRALDGASGIYNVGTGKARSFQDIVDILQRELMSNLKYEYIPNPYKKQYQFHTQANIESTRKGLNYEPEYTLEQGIEDYIPEIQRIFEEEING